MGMWASRASLEWSLGLECRAGCSERKEMGRKERTKPKKEWARFDFDFGSHFDLKLEQKRVLSLGLSLDVGK